MGSGDLTASEPTICTTTGAIKVAIDALNLAATTDHVFIVPDMQLGWLVFKVERAA